VLEESRFNSPNDVIVNKNDNSIWFTDPSYGIMKNYTGRKAPSELKEAVYRIDSKTAKITKVTDDITKPNGLCFSPDLKTLYVSDTGDGENNIKMWDIDGETLKNRKQFTSMKMDSFDKVGHADGIRADEDGNIWSSAGWVGEGYDGVHIFAPNGDRIGQILLPENCANLCFGAVSVIYICVQTHCNHNQNEGNGSHPYSPANENDITFEPPRAGTTLVVAVKVETTRL
jgi:gluconolactonase